MAEAPEVGVRSQDVFNDHDERAPNVAEFAFDAPGDAPLGAGAPQAGHEKARLKGFTDVRRTVHREVVSGPWVIQESTFEGTHTGFFECPAGIIPPTGRRVVVKCVQISRYENGLTTERRLYYDQVDLLTQLGLEPEPPLAIMP
jgi:hypothetical protein